METWGEDFRRARHEWLYRGYNVQPFWLALCLFLALNVVNLLLQMVGGMMVAPFMEGGLGDPRAFIKGTIISMFPASILLALVCYWFAGLRGGNATAAISLHFPRLGILGWCAVVFGFLVSMYIFIILAVTIFGIDLSQYTPGANGESPETGSAGLVKEAMFDLANEPMMFWLSVPAVAIGAPLTEEFLFRGPIFASLAQSPVGRAGAVIITSLAWSLMHITEPWFSVALIFIMGLVLGALLLRFGSLWVTMACHGTWNLVFALVTFGFAGQT